MYQTSYVQLEVHHNWWRLKFAALVIEIENTSVSQYVNSGIIIGGGKSGAMGLQPYLDSECFIGF